MRLVLRPFALTLALGNSNPYLALENFVWHHPLEMFRCGAGVFVPRFQDHRRKGFLRLGGPTSRQGGRAAWSRKFKQIPRTLRPLPGKYSFVDFWSQGWKVMKSSLSGLVLFTSGARAGKSCNPASWDRFCGLLEPRPENHEMEPGG